MAIRTVDPAAEDQLLSVEELRARLWEVGEERYHHRHPFHQLMHEGRLDRGQLQAWALNRYYYQSRIPIKDAIILSRCEDPVFRRVWLKRVLDHDGDGTTDGGIKRWLKLAVATGLDADRVARREGVLPATRYAVNEYLNLVKNRTLLEAVASSLTELFSRDLISLRMERLRIDHRITGDCQWRVELQNIRPLLLRPKSEPRNHRRARMRREFREADARARRYTEEIHEDPLVEPGVLIHQDSHRCIVLERLKNGPREILLADQMISRRRPPALHQRVDTRIVERPNHHVHRC